MPVQETLDGLRELHAAGLPLGAIVINQVRHSELDDAELAMAAARTLPEPELRAGLTAAAIDPAPATVQALADEAADHAARVALQNAERQRLQDSGQPILELPLLPGGIDLSALYALAESLHAQGLPS
jgi:hypothetical protein